MNNNIDKIFREKLGKLQLDPNPDSKRIFMNSLPRNNKNHIRWKLLISAAAIFLFFFLINNYQRSNVAGVEQHEQASELSIITTKQTESQKVNISNFDSELQRTKKKKPNPTSFIEKKINYTNQLSLVSAPVSSDSILDEEVDYMAATIDKNIQQSESQIEIRISGLAEQMIYYAQQDNHSRKRELSMHIAHQKITIPSPIIEDVEQTFNQVKNGILEINLADVGKSLTNSFSSRINTKKNQSQKPN
ncbi:MAG: hypothetical protein ACK4KT_04925 [Thermaurantimonas sp.]